MDIYFDSRTGNVRRFANALGLSVKPIPKDGEVVDGPFVLITYTTGFGEAPPSTLRFLETNHLYLRGVASSGNRNWGDNFAKSADRISTMYQVPILHKFELSGFPEDVASFIERVEALSHETHRVEQ